MIEEASCEMEEMEECGDLEERFMAARRLARLEGMLEISRRREKEAA